MQRNSADIVARMDNFISDFSNFTMEDALPPSLPPFTPGLLLSLRNMSAVSRLDECGFPQSMERLNITHEQNSQLVTLISFPILLIIGTLGNGAGIALIRQSRRKAKDLGYESPLHPRDIFLLSLFVTDMLYL